jgi:hypothetical protein
VATSSSSVAAGDVRHSMAFWLVAAAMSSPAIAAGGLELAKYPKNRGWFQWVSAGARTWSRSARIRSQGTGSAGGSRGRASRTAPGAIGARTGAAPAWSR